MKGFFSFIKPLKLSVRSLVDYICNDLMLICELSEKVIVHLNFGKREEMGGEFKKKGKKTNSLLSFNKRLA